MGSIAQWRYLENNEHWRKPIIHTKVALSFLALYNTPFALNMTIYLEKAFPDSTNGYYSGAEYNTDINKAKSILSKDSNTNGMILGAARYVIRNNP